VEAVGGHREHVATGGAVVDPDMRGVHGLAFHPMFGRAMPLAISSPMF